jgi:hypothetical protein
LEGGRNLVVITPEEQEKEGERSDAPRENGSVADTFHAYREGRLTRPLLPDEEPSPLAEFVHDSFRALILNPRFACVAARSAFNKDNYRFSVYDADLGTPDAARRLARDLYLFVNDQDKLRGEGFSTFVASFTGPTALGEEQFETRLWRQLQHLHDIDAEVSDWDPGVSADPESPHFEFSFGGRAFFVVGLHPASSRLTRRFAFPTLVFNGHFQFERLREEGKYGKVQEAVRRRDTLLQGGINPNLADFGDASDARQYSGRTAGEDWRCPFRAHAPSALDEETGKPGERNQHR